MGLGVDELLSDDEQKSLSRLVDQRLRFIWDFAGVAILTLLLCTFASALDPSSTYLRTGDAFALALCGWTALLALQLPNLFREIKNFRWRLAREQHASDELKAALLAIKQESEQRVSNIPEPELRNGTH
jgi:hypothetical protein